MKTIAITVSFLVSLLMAHIHQDSVPKQATPEESTLIQWMNKTIDSVRVANDVPAISVGVIHKGRVIMTKGFGIYDRQETARVDANSIYQIASDTKKMTGIIARNLAAEGLLDLNTPVIKHLNAFLTDDAKSRLKDVTMNTLLLHTSGLPYRQLTMNRKDGEPFLIPYTAEELQNDLNQVVLRTAPGANFGYSNFGYAVAGYILELVSGKSYAELIQEHIAKPYDLVNTTATLSETQKVLLVTPYFKSDRHKATFPATMGKLSAAGGIYSTISDLMILMNLQMGAYKNLALQNPLVLHKNLSILENDYGFGLGKKVFAQGTQYGHGGDLDGYASAYVFSPEFESGVVILTSSGGKWVGELEKELFFKLTKRKYIAPKKSLAQGFFNLILTKNYEQAEQWFLQHKDSKDYYLKEGEMNNVGYSLLQKEELEAALKVFQWNTKLFPDSANSYDSLGECYLKMGNRSLAIKNYQKSLALDPENGNAKSVLRKIKDGFRN